MKNILIKILPMLLFVVLIYGAYRLLWFGTITLTGLDGFETVTVNNVAYSAKTINTSLRLRPGKYTINAYAPNKVEYSKDISVGVFSTASLEVVSETIDDSELVTYVTNKNLPDEYKVVRGKYLENGHWIVAFIGPVVETSEGWTDIYIFDGFKWSIYESGTGLDREYLQERGVPDSVITYLESVNG